MSLRIPLTVKRCPLKRARDRIRFQYDDLCLTPEGIVLRRWQERSKETGALKSGTRFDGCRLPPGTWRIVHACLADGLSHEDASDPGKLALCIAKVRAEHPTWRAPHPTKLAAVIRMIRDRGVLDRLLSSTRNGASPGIPDLFLYLISEKRGAHGGRFVEVKRKVRRTGYKEPLLPAQRREQDRLRSLGLKVDVVYLLE